MLYLKVKGALKLGGTALILEEGRREWRTGRTQRTTRTPRPAPSETPDRPPGPDSTSPFLAWNQVPLTRYHFRRMIIIG